MTFLHHAITSLLIYVLIMAIIVPTIVAKPDAMDDLLNDSLINTILVSCTAMDGYYILLFDNMTKRKFVKRKRRCVTDLFSEYGPYNVRRAYYMDEMQSWKLYNILYKYSPENDKKGNAVNKIILARMGNYIYLCVLV